MKSYLYDFVYIFSKRNFQVTCLGTQKVTQESPLRMLKNYNAFAADIVDDFIGI
jgi:hypothetical protein